MRIGFPLVGASIKFAVMFLGMGSFRSFEFGGRHFSGNRRPEAKMDVDNAGWLFVLFFGGNLGYRWN